MNEPVNQKDGAENRSADQYWKANLTLLSSLLAVWFICSFGFGILFVEQLNHFSMFGVPLGFWFAQQGSIFTFMVLIFVYVWRMHQIDRQFGVEDDDAPDSYDLESGGGDSGAGE